MNRRIPNVMATQHPDNAAKPYFKHSTPSISAFREIDEAYNNFADLGADEYMWDWEGKNADASVIDRLYSGHFEYFKKHPLGRDKFLTFRFPNIWEEQGYNLMQAMTTMLVAEDLAKDLQFPNRPLFEAILPMTQSADQLIAMEDKFAALAKFKTDTFSRDNHKNTQNIEMIPLIEGFESQLNAPEILDGYMKLYKKHFGKDLSFLRVFLAGSDSALSNGFLNSIIGNKLALSNLGKFSRDNDLPVYPIAGMGSTIFRGGLSPVDIDRYLREYPGLKTATIQSAFRYDYPLDVVEPAIDKLKDGLKDSKFEIINDDDYQVLLNIANKAAEEYHKTLDPIIKDLQPIFSAFPKRRDRHQHVGILGYSRDVDGYKMPRAITFTGSLYSAGVPPELIGTGRTLRNLDDHEKEVLKKYYPDIKGDFAKVARYFSQDALNTLKQRNSAWRFIDEDVQAIDEFLGIKAGPKTEEDRQHADLASDLDNIKDQETRTWLINRMGRIRHFLG